jgi:hypothetical protein
MTILIDKEFNEINKLISLFISYFTPQIDSFHLLDCKKII